MTDFKAWYLDLADYKKQGFLAIVAHQLTIHARYAIHTFSGEQQIRALKGFNELQHQISSHIAAIGLKREGFPDEVLWQILKEEAERYQISPQLAHSLQFARSLSCWDEVS